MNSSTNPKSALSTILQHRKPTEFRKFITEELPRDPELLAMFQEAIRGERKVHVILAGDDLYFKIFKHRYTRTDDGIPLATMCIIAEVDKKLVREILENVGKEKYYVKNLSKKTEDQKRRLSRKSGNTAFQLITNLFPFPKIAWFFLSNNTMTGLRLFPRGSFIRSEAPTRTEIDRLIRIGSDAKLNFWRH